MDPRWFTETDDEHSQWYAEHFRQLAIDGEDLEGEARLLDALVPPASTILDAGCGQGRTAGALYRRGHRVFALDIDPVLIDAASEDNPGPTYIRTDLATQDLLSDFPAMKPFDAAVSAGNVLGFVAPGTEQQVLSNIWRQLAPDAPYVTGFHVDRYALSDFDRDLEHAGFVLESRFATWDLRPWTAGSEFAVSILRKPT
jgi:2-polyprenyl-3-methyl-5-hydroxy-6-metoxy-1,4-benzoquinol methylase